MQAYIMDEFRKSARLKARLNGEILPFILIQSKLGLIILILQLEGI
jgi:hypothetical protein